MKFFYVQFAKVRYQNVWNKTYYPQKNKKIKGEGKRTKNYKKIDKNKTQLFFIFGHFQMPYPPPKNF